MKHLKPTQAEAIHLLEPSDYLLDPSEIAQIVSEYLPRGNELCPSLAEQD